MAALRPAPRRVAAIVVVCLLAQSCTSWQTQPGAPGQVLASKTPERVRVNRPDGSRVELVHPVISGDTLSGNRPGSPADDPAGRIAMPLSEVQSVDIQRVSAGKTVLLIGGLGLTAIVIAAAVSDEPEPASPPPHVSCPLVYSWDGSTWRLDSGTFGGAIAPALARTDVDNLMYAAPENGLLRLRVANELNETDYLDALSVLAVDHAPGFTVAPDGAGRLHTLGPLTPPASARDFRGTDALARVRAADDWSWESNPSGRDTAVTADIRDGIELVFPLSQREHARLVIDGHNSPWASFLMQKFVAAHGSSTQAWYDSLAAHPHLARELGSLLAREAFLGVSVWTGERWEVQGYVWEAGPEILKRQVFTLDLSRASGDSVRIRLESAPSFWLIDHVALDTAAPAGLEVHEIFAHTARDHSGVDVRARVRSRDQSHFVLERGQGAELSFRVPDVPAGRTRSYLVRSSGWYRIHSPETEPADRKILAQVMGRPYGASRVAVGRFNDAIRALEGSRP